jgi:UDP-glucoronosyl and UDP-glucosyl transferase
MLLMSIEQFFGEYQRYGSFQTLDDLMAKSLLWVIPKDHILDYAKPTMPHVVQVGGLTVQRTNGELSNDLRQFVEGARRGVIVVSFGSMIPSFPRSIVEKFFDVFRRLDADGYRIIWRLKSSDGLPVPDNVLTMGWLPQNDLLGHPAVKLFITHCGNNGQYEAIYQGVPMIGFPVLGDQEHNGRRLEHKGYGLKMDIYHFTADELLVNIRRVLDDRKFTDRIKHASQVFRSSPETPVERASYWIEHVARFGGEHLRSGGQDLPLYAYFMLDVVVLLLVVVVVVTYVVLRLFRFVIGRVCGRRQSGDKLKVN